MRKAICAMLSTFLLGAPAVWAGTLHIGGGAGTTCAMGCAGDPNQIGNGSHVDNFQVSGGATLIDPQLLILGVPNDSTNLFLTNPISSVSYYNPYPGGTPVAGTSAFATAGTYGLKSPVAGGFFADMTAGSEIYGFLGLQGPTDNSNSFTNWSAADLSLNGIDATEFGTYVFVLSGGSLEGKSLLDIFFQSKLPTGTFIVAYGQDSKGKPSDVPFTEAGLTGADPTPEPSSLLLLSSGLLGLGVLRRQLRSRFSGR